MAKLREEAPALGVLPAAVGRGRTRTAGQAALAPADPVRAARPEVPARRLERFAKLDQTSALRSVLLHPGDPVQGPHVRASVATITCRQPGRLRAGLGPCPAWHGAPCGRPACLWGTAHPARCSLPLTAAAGTHHSRLPRPQAGPTQPGRVRLRAPRRRGTQAAGPRLRAGGSRGWKEIESTLQTGKNLGPELEALASHCPPRTGTAPPRWPLVQSHRSPGLMGTRDAH